MKVISINVSLPQEIEWKGRKVRTSVFKKPVMGRVMARRLNIDGDAQADLIGHGGEHRAVMVYQTESYEYWKRVLVRDDLHYGHFGENLTVDGLADKEVCIGDRYRIGSAIFEVTQPRVTCYRVGISLGIPEMAALLVSHRRPGFYLRVIQEGEIGAGDAIQKLSDGPESMTIADIDQLLYSKDHPKDSLAKALKIPALSKGWQYSFNELLTAAADGVTSGNVGLAGPQARPLAWTGYRRFVIKQARMETADVRSFELTPEDQQPLAPFAPGQHLAIRIPVDPAGPPLIRMYSLCGPPGVSSYRIAVKRDGRGSISLLERLQEGSVIEVSAPRGSFTLLPGQHPVVLLAAGVGITPLLAMLYAIKQDSPAREVWWIYATQNLEHYCFSKEVREISAELGDLQVVDIFSRPRATEVQGVDFKIQGHLNLEVLKGLGIPVQADFYLCGPAAYLADTIAALKALGIPEDRIRYEAFGQSPITGNNWKPPGMDVNTKAPHLPAENDGTGPLLTFTKSNISFPWNSKFGSLLEAAEAGDIPVHWSCRTGVCHLCESSLLDGDIAYSPDPLDPPAAGRVLLCCSRPLSSVTLEL